MSNDRVTIVCGKCHGVGTYRRHGWPEEEACPMCGGRGVMVVTAQSARDTAAEVVPPAREKTVELLKAIRERLEEGQAYHARLHDLRDDLERHASTNVRDMGHEGLRRAVSCADGILEALHEAILHIRQAETWDAEALAKMKGRTS